jgi:dynein heavy chain
MIARGLQLNENLVVKIMQLYESKVTRHGNMLVGATLSGKTSAWKILVDALNRLSENERKENKSIKPEDQKFMPVKYHLINPKSITIDELYGNNDD